MSLMFSGPKGTIERRWILYALLRDNVQHHLEGGTPGARFGAIHGVVEALGGRRTRINARELHAQAVSARDQLLHRPIDQLAIGARTRAVVSREVPRVDANTTALVPPGQTYGIVVLEGAKTLDDVFGPFVNELVAMTEGAGDDDFVEVSDL